MPFSPDLLTIVVDSQSPLDKESELYRSLISAHLEWEDRYQIQLCQDGLTTKAIQELCSSTTTRYIMFVRDTHSVSSGFVAQMLESLEDKKQYLVEPKIYMGDIPSNTEKTQLNDSYYYKRDTDVFGVAFNTRRLAEALNTLSDLDRSCIYTAYRLYWSVEHAPVIEAGFSVNSVTKVAIGINFSLETGRFLPKIQTSSRELRLYVLRLLVLYLRGLRESRKSQISLTHLREIATIHSLDNLMSNIDLSNSFETGFISWILNPDNYLHLFKQLKSEDSYIVFPSENDPNNSYYRLYEISFSDQSIEIGKEYIPNAERAGFNRPGSYNFYSRSVRPDSKIIFFDRPMHADDNAEHLYRYFTKNYPEYTNVYFALNPKSKDWDRLRDEGFNLIHFFSKEFYELFLVSDLVVSSQIYNLEYRGKNLSNSRFVYLQHGIQLNDMTNWILSKHFDIFVATGKNEYDYLTRIAPRETLNSGIPRLESLAQRKKKEADHILFMPTWRFNLQTASVEHFIDSEYCKTINNILTDEKLLEYLENQDKTLLVQLHPNIEKRANCFQFSKRVINSTYTYAEAIAGAEMVFTDYSSVALDAAFIGTPIAYYTWDFAEFFQDQPYSSRVDYFSDGLGPVFMHHNEIIDYIVSEKFKHPSEEYINRRERFFEGVEPQKINETIIERMLAL